MPEFTPPIALERRLIYHSHWVNLYVDRVKFPNGMIIDQHHLLDFERQAVMSVPQSEDGRYLMVRVVRYPTASASWEFPAGSVEPGESIFQAAEREVMEETGYASSGYEIIYTYYPMNGIANSVFHVLTCHVTAQTGVLDPREVVEAGWFTADQIWQMIQEKTLVDGYTLTAFLLDQGTRQGSN